MKSCTPVAKGHSGNMPQDRRYKAAIKATPILYNTYTHTSSKGVRKEERFTNMSWKRKWQADEEDWSQLEWCRHFVRGHCNVANCKFYHPGPAELAGITETDIRHPKSCKYFARQGWCHEGDQCEYVHSHEAVAQHAAAKAAAAIGKGSGTGKSKASGSNSDKGGKAGKKGAGKTVPGSAGKAIAANAGKAASPHTGKGPGKFTTDFTDEQHTRLMIKQMSSEHLYVFIEMAQQELARREDPNA